MSKPSTATVSPPARGAKAFGSLMVMLLAIELFSGVVQTYFSPLLAVVAEKYGVSLGTISWAQIAPTLALVIVTPVLARLGDLHGHRTMLRVAVGMVTVGSVLVAVAPNFGTLLAGRALQGGIGAFLPLMFGLLEARHPGDQTRRGIGYLCAMLMLGALAGTALAGPLAQAGLAWPLWVVAAGLGCGFLLLVVADRGPETAPAAGDAMDWPGALLLSAGLVCLILGIEKGATWGYGSGRTLGLFAAGVLVLAVWAGYELRVERPLMDLRYLFQPRLVPVFAVGFLMYFAFLGSLVPNATFLSLPDKLTGYGMGLDSTGVSLALLPPFVIMALTAASTARVARGIGYPRAVALGCILFAVGSVGIWAFHGGLIPFIVVYSVMGAGFGFIEGGTRTIVADTLNAGEVSVGVGIYELSIGVGAAVGTAIVGAVLTANVHGRSPVPAEHGYVLSWAILSAAAILGAVVAVWYAIYRGRQTTAASTTSEGAVR